MFCIFFSFTFSYYFIKYCICLIDEWWVQGKSPILPMITCLGSGKTGSQTRPPSPYHAAKGGGEDFSHFWGGLRAVTTTCLVVTPRSLGQYSRNALSWYSLAFGAWNFLKDCLEAQALTLPACQFMGFQWPVTRSCCPRNYLPRGKKLNTALTTRKSLKKSTLA